MSKTPPQDRQGRTLWDVLPDTARALTEDGGCGCLLWLVALVIVACTVVAVAQVLRP